MLGSLCILAQANAAVVYSENFDGLTAGTSTLADSTGWSAPAGDYAVQAAADSSFSSNSLLVSAPDANTNFADWTDGVTRTLITVSFQVEDDSVSTGTGPLPGFRLATSRATTNASLVDLLEANIADDTIFSYHIVSNIGASAAIYEDGVTSIAAGGFDVWVDGVRTVTSGGLVGNGAGDIDGVGLWSRRPGATMNLDNLEIRDTAFNGASGAPEPSSVSLLGLGALGLLRRSR
ncbi:PEP-CTERM sorting domain-containing protein [Akkermansiaceae bacterium]|nr:PEP-CTERM sorting domain-containing protein [Akkermansiaceae bacterium]